MYHKEFKCKKCGKKVIDYNNGYTGIELANQSLSSNILEKDLHICTEDDKLVHMGILELIGFLYYKE